MECHGGKYVALEEELVDAKNLVATIVVLKALYQKLPSSTDVKQLVRDTKKKVQPFAGAHVSQDIWQRLQVAAQTTA